MLHNRMKIVEKGWLGIRSHKRSELDLHWGNEGLCTARRGSRTFHSGLLGWALIEEEEAPSGTDEFSVCYGRGVSGVTDVAGAWQGPERGRTWPNRRRACSVTEVCCEVADRGLKLSHHLGQWWCRAVWLRTGSWVGRPRLTGNTSAAVLPGSLPFSGSRGPRAHSFRLVPAIACWW